MDAIKNYNPAWPAINQWIEREQMQVISRQTLSGCIEAVYIALEREHSWTHVMEALKGLGFWPRSIGRCAYAIVFDPAWDKVYRSDWYM